MKPQEVVAVVWNDSMGSNVWQTRDGFKPSDMRCVTFGFVFAETEQSIILARSWCAEGGADGHMEIPKSAVIDVYELHPDFTEVCGFSWER